MKKRNRLILCVLLPLLVGGIAAFLTRGGMAAYEAMRKPPLSPPGWLFPIVWTVLYILMGIASWQVATSRRGKEQTGRALLMYGLQLAANFCWPLLFFRQGWYWISFVWLLLLWYLILQTIFLFEEVRRSAAYLLLPYLLWVTFAGYLNAGAAILN